MDYQVLVGKQLEYHLHSEWELLSLLQKLCPQDWYIQFEASLENSTFPVFFCTVHNGDDNVTASGKTMGSATAKAIAYLLDGSVYPLGGGNMGKYIAPDVETKYPLTDEEFLGILEAVEKYRLSAQRNSDGTYTTAGEAQKELRNFFNGFILFGRERLEREILEDEEDGEI